MLTHGGDDMIPRPQQPAQGGVQRAGGVGRKGNAGRVRRVEKLCQRFPCGIYQPGSMQGRLMGTAAGVACGVQGVQNGGVYFLRFVQRGGSIVQIDHGLTTFPAWVSFSTMAYMFVTLPTASFSVRP